MHMKRILPIFIIVLMMAGCSTTTAIGVTLGGLSGTVLGGFIGHTSGHRDAQGATIGAVVGAILGAIISKRTETDQNIISDNINRDSDF